MPELPLKIIQFRAFRDEDAGVWIATSDTDRITTEAETKQQIVERLAVIVPDVLLSRSGRTGPLQILIDWQEWRTVDQTAVAIA